MSAAITPARLAFSEDGTPYSSLYGDVYHTRAGGLAQAREVFIAGNDLPTRWQNREVFTILETGFGLGLNFLATWQAWRNDPQACQRLHFISVEKHPFSAIDLKTLHAAWPELSELTEALHAKWPPLISGFHRLFLNQGRVILTLIFGDARQELRRVEAKVNAFYLDGFSPAKNPELWDQQIARALERAAAPNATLATWSVAGQVRRILTEAGFDVEKRPGFGSKRHMLTGIFRHQKPIRYTPPSTRSALVIGAGIAGTSIAERLAERGWQVTVLESKEHAGQGASGNLAGVLRPLPSADDNPVARLTRAGFLAAIQHLQALQQAGLAVRWHACGVFHLAQDPEQAAAQRKAVKRLGAPATYLQFLEPDVASARLGYAAPHGAWFFPTAGWLQPSTVCQANLLAHPNNIHCRFNTHVADIQQHPDGHWQAIDSQGNVIATAAIAVMASGVGATAFSPFKTLAQRSVRGQVTHLPETALRHPLKHLACGHGYIAPAVDGIHVLGASTVHDDTDEDIRESEHTENPQRLEALLPDCLARDFKMASHVLGGRVGFRPASPDRLPIVGPAVNFELPTQAHPKPIPGLWCIQGFGARGIVWSALMAELLACQINAEPLPLPHDLVHAVRPARLQGCVISDETDCDTMSQV